MKTDDLISMLASNVEPVDPHTVAKRFGVAVSSGILVSTLLVIFLLGIRADIVLASTTALFWAKVALPFCLMVGALLVLMRLSRPGMTSGGGRILIVAALAVVWLGGLYALITAQPDARVGMIFGKTWQVCALNITLLSIPTFIATFYALRGLAPTRPRLAGGCAGLLAGSVAATAYCLHCPEMAIPFWGTWYLLGVLIPALIGFLSGPRWLRW